MSQQCTIECMVRSCLTISTSKSGSKMRDQFSWTYFFCQSYCRKTHPHNKWLVVIMCEVRDPMSLQLTCLLSKIWYMSLLRWLVS